MSTSDNMPPNTGSDQIPADEQRLDRLYHRMNQDDSASSSPTDLDDLIRAAAKTPQQPPASGYWQWQQRAGWATAAAVVLTSALFLALPEPAPELANSTKSKHTNPTVMTAPVALDADVQAPTSQTQAQQEQPQPEPAADVTATLRHLAEPPPSASVRPTMEFAVDMAVEMPVEISKPSAGQTLSQSHRRKTDTATTASRSQDVEEVTKMNAVEPIIGMDQIAEMANLAEAEQIASSPPAAMAPALGMAARQDRSNAASSKLRKPNCESIAIGLIRRICDAPESNNSYLLQPNPKAQCKTLRLDEQVTRPTPNAESTAEEFVYTVGGRKFSATCSGGKWVVQPFARGR